MATQVLISPEQIKDSLTQNNVDMEVDETQKIEFAPLGKTNNKLVNSLIPLPLHSFGSNIDVGFRP
jgi:hypothetical protein